MIGLLVTLASVAVNLGCCVLYLRMRRRARASWRDAHRFAEVAHLQARVIAECSELLCDDCKRIVNGHYMQNAWPAVAAFLDEES